MNCQLETRYICKNYSQISCPFFKSLEDMATTTCYYGLPDRICQNKEARKEALRIYLILIKEIPK